MQARPVSGRVPRTLTAFLASLALLPASAGAQVIGGGGSTFTRIESKLLASEAFEGDSSTLAGDEMRRSVAISGELLAVGAPFAYCVPCPAPLGGVPSGAVYVYRRVGLEWVPIAPALGPDSFQYHYFGWSVALAGDRLVVGAPGTDHSGLTNAGSVYVYRIEEDAIVWEGHLMASDAAAHDWFGTSVAVDPAGDRILVGAPQAAPWGMNSGAAYTFRYDGSHWVEEDQMVAPCPSGSCDLSGERFGDSVDLHGDRLVVGAPYGDRAFVFYQDPDQFVDGSGNLGWFHRATLDDPTPSGEQIRFGQSVSIENCIDDCVGYSAVVVGGPRSSPNANEPGQAFVFEPVQLGSLVVWELAQTLVASHTTAREFGHAHQMDGDLLVVGSRSDDSAYVYRRADTAPLEFGPWEEEERLLPDGGSDAFGYAVAASWPDGVLVGASADDEDDGNAGAAFVYDETQCTDGLDNDHDGLRDSEDPDCESPADGTEFHLEQGDIVAADASAAGRIERIDPVTGERTLLFEGGFLGAVYDVVVGRDGDLYASDQDAAAIVRLGTDRGTQELVTEFVVTPTGMAVEAAGTLLVMDQHYLVRANPETGGAHDFSTGGELTGARFPMVNAAGGILVGTPNGIVRVDPESGDALDVELPFLDASTCALDARGRVVIVDATFGDAALVDLGTGTITPLGSFGEGVEDVEVDALGRMVATTLATRELVRLDWSNGVLEPLATDAWMSVTIVPRPPRCSDGVDNDGDGSADLADPQCSGPYDDFEAPACGLGFEPVLMLPFLIGLRQRRRAARR